MADDVLDALLSHLKAFGTPTVCAAVEALGGGLQEGGFTLSQPYCAFRHMDPVVGFARTAVLGRAPAGHDGNLAYYAYLAQGRHPAVAVVQDRGDAASGAFWGEAETAIHRGLGLLGCVTDGGVRDLGAIDPRFQVLAGRVCPNPSPAAVVGFDGPVEVFGMKVAPGDLIHADRHGAVVVPREHLAALPEAIDLCRRREEPLLRAARAGSLGLDDLRAALAEARAVR
ncbi:MAG: RraA family protein [Geminicoccaceae bacterium]|nr:RraA family protein [Geminicoccaceae bacterium]